MITQEEVRDYLESLIEQYKQKNAAYGNNAHRTYCIFGNASYAIRLLDKAQRLETLLSNSNISSADESIYDTIGDAITYSSMWIGDIVSGFKYGGDYKNHPELEDNIPRTIVNLRSLECYTLDEIKESSDTFEKTYMKNVGDKTSDGICNIYNSGEVEVLGIFLLSLHFLQKYIDLKNKEREIK